MVSIPQPGLLRSFLRQLHSHGPAARRWLCDGRFSAQLQRAHAELQADGRHEDGEHRGGRRDLAMASAEKEIKSLEGSNKLVPMGTSS